MKTNRFRAVLLISALVAAIPFIVNNISLTERDRHERFIATQLKQYSPADERGIGADEKRPDRPDQAALAEYLKTLDPSTRAVPAERLLAANLAADKSARLKTGGSGLTWNSHPTNMGGRVRTLMFDPNDTSNKKLWAGSVTGGLWYNTDPAGGGEWKSLDDFWPNLSISCMAYDPNNTKTFYVGTGESQTALIIYRESSGRGTGILRSTDGGETWAPMPSTQNWPYVTDILVRNENGTSVIYAGVVSGVYKGIAHRAEPTNGLYRSADNGATWTQVLPNVPGKDFSYAPSDIETSSDGQRIIVGTTYGVNAEVTDNDRTGAANILVSSDGLSWTVISTYEQRILAENTNKYPGRVMLCNAPSNPNILYAIVASGYVRSDKFIGYGCQFLLKSTNKGDTWTELNFPGGFASLAWHAFVVGTSPLNPNIIWVGGLDTWRSVNGGTTWTKQSDWAQMYGNGADNYVHADIHSFKFRPGTDTELFIGTDGGVFATRTASAPDVGMKFFEIANNFSTLQYYSCAIHPEADAIHFIGGLQDNGTMFYRRGNTPTFRDMLSGGDGALCFIDQNEPAIQITTVYHNMLYLWNGNKEADPQNSGFANFGTGMFVNAMDYDWKNNILFANGANEQLDNLNTYHVVNVSATGFSGNTAARPLNTRVSVPYTNLKWSEHSPVGKSTLYIGTMAGQIFRLDDASRNGTLAELTPTDFPAANLSSIDIAGSEDTLLVTFSNYGVPSVWLTVNGGASWKNVEANLPDMPVRWGIFHPQTGKHVMLATEAGIWTTDNILANNVIWSADNSGLANVRIDMLKVRKSDNTVLAATHGRGMFTARWDPSYTSGTGDVAATVQELRVYPNPGNGLFNVTVERIPARISVSDLTGKLVLQRDIPAGNHIVIDLTGHPKGTYLVRAESEGTVYSRRIILE